MARNRVCRPGVRQSPEGGGHAESARTTGLWLYLAEVNRIPPLAPTREERLLRRIRRGDLRAVDEMALGHLGLVADIVAPQGVDGDGLPDRLDRGNRALLEAIFSFASSGGGDFREYAASHVRRAVQAEPPDPGPWAVQQDTFPVA